MTTGDFFKLCEQAKKLIKITYFWDLTPCCLVDKYQGLGVTYCLHLQGKTTKGTGIEPVDIGRQGGVPKLRANQGVTLALEGVRNHHIPLHLLLPTLRWGNKISYKF
jgi:hypothetical protein